MVRRKVTPEQRCSILRKFLFPHSRVFVFSGGSSVSFPHLLLYPHMRNVLDCFAFFEKKPFVISVFPAANSAVCMVYYTG